LTWEAFTQLQFDDVQDIELRYLAGTGPRFQLIQTDTAKLFWGVLAMFDYEETSEDPNDESIITIYRDIRLSTYLSTSFRVKKFLTINHVTYFQPVLNRWSDFRISSETRINIALRKNVSLNSFFQFVYDTRPALDVPPLMFALTNGLSISI